jgi:hypothetical protein
MTETMMVWEMAMTTVLIDLHRPKKILIQMALGIRAIPGPPYLTMITTRTEFLIGKIIVRSVATLGEARMIRMVTG